MKKCPPYIFTPQINKKRRYLLSFLPPYFTNNHLLSSAPVPDRHPSLRGLFSSLYEKQPFTPSLQPRYPAHPPYSSLSNELSVTMSSYFSTFHPLSSFQSGFYAHY